MKKLYFLIVLALILGLTLTGCSLLSNISQVPTTGQSGISYLTKEILYSELVALWHFDGDADDSSGNSNNGTVEGAFYVDSTVGMGKALSFDGDDYVKVDYNDTLDITNEITIEAWIKPTAVSGYRTIVAKRSGGVANYALRLWSGKVEFYYRKAGATTWSEWLTNDAPVIADGSSYYIAVTYTFGDSDSIRVYIDDTLYDGYWKYGVAEDVSANAYPVYIGCISPSSQPFIGLIDEVRIWNFALSQDQLGKVYDFVGFFPPIDDGVLNVVKAGRAIPVKFSLDGDQGLEDIIFVPGYPKSKQIPCDSETFTDDITETITAGGSSLNYDDTIDQYIYVWKTDKDWTGCRQLVVKLIDGTSHVANFTFK